jgi:hypothetical protein
MHILVALAGTLGALAFLLYRFSLMKQGADDVIDTVERAAGAWRRRRFRNKAERPPLETETDPRAAAAAIAVSITASSAPPDAATEATLCREFEEVLGVGDGGELLAYGRWLTKDMVDPNAVTDRVAGLLNNQLWQTQKQDMLDMFVRISKGDPVQVQALGHLKHKLGL